MAAAARLFGTEGVGRSGRPSACWGKILVLVLLAMLPANGASGLPRYGPLELSGNVSSQQLIRHPDIDQYAFIQQRNTLRLRVDYLFLDAGRLADRVDVPGIDRARLFLLYRGVYDSVYDTTPGFEQNNIYDQQISDIRPPVRSRLDDLDGDKFKFENQLREAYVDLYFKHIPFSMRLGRQQIVWGETDNFRLLDRTNALDLTWHLQQEPWDELRIPYWMIKGLWTFGQLGPLSSSFLEFYWNPGDWYPGKRAFLPRPWSAPINDPFERLTTLLKNYGIFAPDAPGTLLNGTKPFRQGDYHRNPGDNSQVGVRFSALTPQGVQFTLNYFYQRWAGDDGTNAAIIKAAQTRQEVTDAYARGELPIEFIAPYVHAVGLSLNYPEDRFTQSVFRMETIYEFGVPFSDASKPIPDALLGRDLFGVSKRDMWKGMIGFDRPTWIRAINRKSTVLILGQFFWHYLIDNPDVQCNDPNESPPCSRSGQGKGFRGLFSTSGLLWGTRPYIDKVRDWEALVTLTATSFFQGGKLVPLVAYILDPVNKYNMEVLWAADYFLTNNFILHVGQRYFINTTGDPVFETWGVGGINRGRSETEVRFTYQF